MPDQTYHRIAGAAGIFLAAHLVFAYWSPFSLWGLDHLAYYPAWAHILFAVLAAIPFFPPAQAWLLQGFSRLPVFTLPAGAVFILIGVALFTVFKSAVHLLGDGELCLREIGLGTGRRGNEPLTFWLLERLHRLLAFTDDPALQAYRLYAYLAGGLYLGLALASAHTWGRTAAARACILVFLCSLGLVQHFFGYVENYALLMPGILLYFFLALRFLNGAASPYGLAGLLGLLVLLHFAMLTLAPSLLVLFYLRSRLYRRAPPAPDPAPVPFVHLILALLWPVAPGLVALWALDLDLLTYLQKELTSHLLPLLATPNFKQAYRVFSLDHGLDYANLLVLVSPAALLILCGLPPLRRTVPAAEHRFLWAAVWPPLAFAFFFNPEIGFGRDWDLLSFALLPLGIWAVLHLCHGVEDTSRLARIALVLGWSAGLHTLCWIGLNARQAPSVLRYTHLLEHSPLSGHARSYGWDTLGEYYRQRGQARQALAAYQSATRANPTNPRHWAGQAYQHLALNQQRPAVEAFRQALAFDSTNVLLWNRLGLTYFALEEYTPCSTALQRAIDLGLNDHSAWFILGEAHRLNNEPTEAIRALQKALALNSNSADIQLSLGIAYRAVDATDKAVQALHRAAALDPTLVDAYNQLGHLYMQQQQLEKAKNAFQQVATLDPDYAEAHYNLAFVHYRLNQREPLRRHGEIFLRLWRGDPAFAARIERLLAQ